MLSTLLTRGASVYGPYFSLEGEAKADPPLDFIFPFVPLTANSGTISTTNIVDRILGLLSAMLRFKPLDGINDHSKHEYKRLFAQAVINKRVSLIAKTKSVVVDAMQKVTLV